MGEAFVIPASILACRLVAIAIFASFFAVVTAAAQSFQTSRISVCSNVIKAKTDRCDEVSAPFDGLKRTVFPNKRIDFKLIILGQDQAIAYLQKNGFLPIKVGVWRNGFRRDTDMSIDIDQNNWASDGDKLVTDLNQNGQFTWRTFFHVNINDAQSISIEINDGNGTLVQAAGDAARVGFSFSN
jgi:hypothetical protein